MKATLIQSTEIADTNRGERALLMFLQDLPDDCTVYRELKVTTWNRVRGTLEKRPDFVVVSPSLGVVSLECKDWNLDVNQYIWRDQYEIVIKRPNNQPDEIIKNPFDQAQQYLFALKNLLGSNIRITSLVAFPRLSRQQFLNKLANARVLEQPQSRFYVDFNQALFKEDLDRYAQHPADLLDEIVRKSAGGEVYSAETIEHVNNQLMPPGFYVGGFTKRQQAIHQRQLMSEQQRRWIANVDDQANYLLDVPGSGKTNALIAKAMLMVDHANHEIPPRILLTTYSHILAVNIQRLFNAKLAGSDADRNSYRSISIVGFRELLEIIWRNHEGAAKFAGYRRAQETDAEYEQRLSDDVEALVTLEPERYCRFDMIFIDEIQDFDNHFLGIAKRLCRSNRFFFVGDIGQKIYERRHDLAEAGFPIKHAHLPKHYQMYRTPRFIAELANRFIFDDPVIRDEFKDNGYAEKAVSQNQLDNAAEFLKTSDSERAVVERIQSQLSGAYTEDDIMIVTEETQWETMENMLDAVHIPHARAQKDGCVIVVDYMHCKGLEREVVFVTHIEALYEQRQQASLFEDADRRAERERYSRRKIYVALTRPLDQLIVYYTDPNNSFIGQLLRFNAEIDGKRRQQIRS